MIKKLNAVLILIFLNFGLVFSDTDGVWHETEDVRVGVFGSDEGDVTSKYSFINPLEVNNTLSITNNAGSLDLIGTDHTYIEFFPKGLLGFRRGWIGFGDSLSNDLFITNENVGANLRLRASNVLIENNLTVAGGEIIIGDDGSIRDGGGNYLYTLDRFDSVSQIRSPIFYDRDDATYFMNMAGVSNVSRIRSTNSTNPITDDELVTKSYVDLNDDINDGDFVIGNEIQNVISDKGLTRDLNNNFGIINCAENQILKYVASKWICTAVVDGDSDSSNELQDLSSVLSRGNTWGTASVLSNSQGGSIELGGTGTPYIDFKNDNSDFDMRLILTNNDALTVTGGSLFANGGKVATLEDATYDGMKDLDGGTSNWIRTTTNGIIPVTSGGASSLGTNAWPFNSVYSKTFKSDINAVLPKIVLDSISTGDNWLSQGAQISLGESGEGTASLHLTYRGDGYGFIGSGAISNGEPGASYLRFDYNSNNIYTPDTITAGNLKIGTSDVATKAYVDAATGGGDDPPITFDVKHSDTSTWACVDRDLQNLCGDEDGCTIRLLLQHETDGNDQVRTIDEHIYLEDTSFSNNRIPGEIYGWARQEGGGDRSFILGRSNLRYTIHSPWDWTWAYNYRHDYCPGQVGHGPAKTGAAKYTFTFMSHPNVKTRIIVYDR